MQVPRRVYRTVLRRLSQWRRHRPISWGIAPIVSRCRAPLSRQRQPASRRPRSANVGGNARVHTSRTCCAQAEPQVSEGQTKSWQTKATAMTAQINPLEGELCFSKRVLVEATLKASETLVKGTSKLQVFTRLKPHY